MELAFGRFGKRLTADGRAVCLASLLHRRAHFASSTTSLPSLICIYVDSLSLILRERPSRSRAAVAMARVDIYTPDLVNFRAVSYSNLERHVILN